MRQIESKHVHVWLNGRITIFTSSILKYLSHLIFISILIIYPVKKIKVIKN
jgi:hypothetical protein